MAIKPILFNTEMVRAILNGRKTQTRRIVKQPPVAGDILHDEKGWYYIDGTRNGHSLIPPFTPGDILWVREAWYENKNPQSKNFGGYEYLAEYDKAMCKDLIKWRPSIHMPKNAARIFLLVTNIRVEHLKDMTAIQAMGEGFTDWNDAISIWNSTINRAEIHRYGWDANPWVFVIEFERCEKPEGWCDDETRP